MPKSLIHKTTSFLFHFRFYKVLSLLIIGVVSNPVWSQSSQNKPKLVVGVVVDQMRYDYLTRFADDFGTDGFKELLANGFHCKNNYLNYVPSNTAPGHASIYTGTPPANHGIINNVWYDVNQKENVYCAIDTTSILVGTGSKNYGSSPIRLQRNTIGDLNRTQTRMRGKTISIALKDRAAVLSGGRKANAAYWYRGKGQGAWITSSYYMDKLPKWVTEFNEADVVQKYMRTWNTLYPITNYTESRVDANDYETGFIGKAAPSFPYDLQQLALKNGNLDLVRATPFGNSLTVDFALSAIDGESLGRDNFTDFLLIGFSSTDYIGHNFGVNSKEVQDTYVRLDRDIARLIAGLNQKVGKGNYTLVLTSDHGASPVSNYIRDQGASAGYFKEASFKIRLKDFVLAEFGEANIIEAVSGDQVYFDRKLIGKLQLNLDEIQNKVSAFISNQDDILLCTITSQLAKSNSKEEIKTMMKNGYFPNRSGDIWYILKPYTVVYSEKGSSHGSPFEFDTHIPLIFYGAQIKNGSSITKTFSVDIAPTIAAILGIPTQTNFTGRVVTEALKN